MSWGLVVITALLVACILAAPASAAGIKSFTDSQGVIRISNTGPAASKPSQAEPPAAAPASPEISKEVNIQPEAGPRLAAAALPISGEQANAPAPAAKPSPGEQVGIPAAADKSLLYLPSAPKRVENSPPAPENREAAGPLNTVTDPGPLPVQKVAFDPDTPGPAHTPGPALAPGAQAAASPKPELASQGGISRFRDRQGVLVITNAASAPPETAPPLLQAENRVDPGKDFLEKQLDRPGPAPAAPNLRPVSWSPDQPAVAPIPAAAVSAGISAPVPGGTIRRYRDKDGVMHIENVGPGAGEPTSPPVLAARSATAEATGPPALPGSATAAETGAPPAVTPVAQFPVEEGQAPALRLQTATYMQAEIGPPGATSRYRDRLGIWQIKAPDDHWILAASPLPRPPANTREVLLAAVNTVARLPEVSLPQIEAPRLPQVTELPDMAWIPGPAVPSAPASSRNYRGIATARDRQGRLVITNAPPQGGISNGPSWALASAQLEPIIQEAARAYQLPPTLIRTVIKVESNFFHLAVSPKGAMGLMQLMPGTAQFLGVHEPFNPRENIYGGCRYLRMLIDSFGGSLLLALAAYNAGPQRVVASGYRVPEISETQNFLTQVIGRYLTEEKKARSPWT